MVKNIPPSTASPRSLHSYTVTWNKMYRTIGFPLGFFLAKLCTCITHNATYSQTVVRDWGVLHLMQLMQPAAPEIWQIQFFQTPHTQTVYSSPSWCWLRLRHLRTFVGNTHGTAVFVPNDVWGAQGCFACLVRKISLFFCRVLPCASLPVHVWAYSGWSAGKQSLSIVTWIVS